MTPSSDWACGTGGADCTPIQQGGPCSHPADSNQGHSNRKFQSRHLIICLWNANMDMQLDSTTSSANQKFFKLVLQMALDLARGSRTVKIADFGVVCVESSNPNNITGETGTLGHMALEVMYFENLDDGNGFPVWLKYVPAISFKTDNGPLKAPSEYDESRKTVQDSR
ncbi:hypothetical protein L2E82_19455 [Cichorium intybus]|uniref:Uncharacterized protein n=1 Tax=Cichorium intybus TaxID=13427 RepID=A0ACB9FCM2_CICIN|nr:hypothetical protein L2E82_19455 [Cichorium intybus]